MECTVDCIQTFIGVPVSFVQEGIGEFFHANAELIWNLMGW